MQVTVIAAAPVAAIDGGDRTVSVSDVLTLDGSLSFDPDAVTVTDTSTVSFQWYTQSFTAASSTRLRSGQLSERRSYDPAAPVAPMTTQWCIVTNARRASAPLSPLPRSLSCVNNRRSVTRTCPWTVHGARPTAAGWHPVRERSRVRPRAFLRQPLRLPQR